MWAGQTQQFRPFIKNSMFKSNFCFSILLYSFVVVLELHDKPIKSEQKNYMNMKLRKEGCGKRWFTGQLPRTFFYAPHPAQQIIFENIVRKLHTCRPFGLLFGVRYFDWLRLACFMLINFFVQICDKMSGIQILRIFKVRLNQRFHQFSDHSAVACGLKFHWYLRIIS